LAKYTPGPLVGQLSRAQGNTVFSHNRGGSYMRNRVVPVNPGTVAQLQRRTWVTLLAQTWGTLTAAQRAAWTALGALMTRLDSLGQPYTLTGLQAYESVNLLRLLAAQATIADPPPFDAAPQLNTVTPTVTGGGIPAFSVAFAPTPFPAGTRGLLYATASLSPGRSFFGHPGVPAQSPGLYKFIAFTAAAQASPFNALAAYTPVFGVPITGKKVSVQLIPISANFLAGQPVRGDTIVL